MEERVIISEKTTRNRGKAFGYARNILAGIGVLSVVALLLIVGLSWIQKGLGVKTVFKAVANGDGSAKATIYQIDLGAMAATRTYVALSNAKVDGSEHGDDVLTFLHLGEDARDISLDWKTNRLLVITYPPGAEIEFAVSKTRGIVIQPAPK